MTFAVISFTDVSFFIGRGVCLLKIVVDFCVKQFSNTWNASTTEKEVIQSLAIHHHVNLKQHITLIREK
jgi:hypothetical protein